MTTVQSAAHAGIHSLDHFALYVPDMDRARHFFTAFGLALSDASDHVELRAADGHCAGRLYPGPAKRLAYLCFGCYQQDLATLLPQLEAAGARPAPPAPGWTEGHWYTDPDGNLLQLRVTPKTSPTGKTPNAHIDIPGNERGACNRSAAQQVRPRRLSHVLLFTPDVLRALDFYRDALGLRLSDRSRDIIAFMHASHGSDHHLLAFAKSPARGWHHSSWDVHGVDEVGMGAAQMAAAGYQEGWGTGRHVLGSNYFHYVRDPWGSFAEYSAHIDYIAAGHDWAGADHPPEDSLYLWGPDVPPYFIENSEAR